MTGVALNDAAIAALEWRDIARRQRTAQLTVAEFLGGERLQTVLDFLMNVMNADHPSILTATVVRGRGDAADTVVDIPPTIRDRIRAAQEVARLLGLTRDTTRVQVAVGSIPARPPADEQDDVPDPVAFVISALELSHHDDGENARLAVLIERLAEDNRRQRMSVSAHSSPVQEVEIVDAEVITVPEAGTGPQTSSQDADDVQLDEQPPAADDPSSTVIRDAPSAPWRPPEF